MILTYRYKPRPTRAQYQRLAQMCELQRLLYNGALEERIVTWRRVSKSVSKFDQMKSLTVIREHDEAYRAMPVWMSRWTLTRIDEAMKGFFGRVKRGVKAGFPRYKPMSRWRSFGFEQWDGIRLDGDRLIIKSMVGAVRLHMHRSLPADAVIKCCTFTKKNQHWWITMAVDVPVAAAHAAPDTAVGIDIGVVHLAATSDGDFFSNVRPRSRREKELRRASRALARCKRGSKRRGKILAKLARAQKRVADFRSNHLHQVSAEITRRYALIGVEKLKLKNMTRSARGSVDEPGRNVRAKSGLNRALADAAPGRLIQLIAYKAERAGGTMVKVDPRGTSQDCSSCGTKVEKTLSERTHRCVCGTELDRDVNARKTSSNGHSRSTGGAGRPETPTWGRSPSVVSETRSPRLHKLPKRRTRVIVFPHDNPNSINTV